MKKIILGVLVLTVLVVLGVAFFIATFNADKYRPLLVKKAEEATGKKVSLDHISLVWKNGVALEVRGFKLYAEASQNAKPSAEIESATAVVRLLPLLNKDIQVVSVILSKPRLEIERDNAGNLTVAGVSPSAGTAGQGAASTSAPAGMLLSVDSIQIKDAEIYFHDRSAAVPLELSIKKADIAVKHFSMTKCFNFDARFSVFSDKQNIDISGQAILPQAASAAVVKNVVLKTDLSLLDLEALKKAVPSIADAGLKAGLAGETQIMIDACVLDSPGIHAAKASLRIQNGRVEQAQLPTPVERLMVDAALENDKLQIREISANFAEGRIRVSGSIDRPLSQAISDLRLKIEDLALASLMPPLVQNAPGLSGRLSADMQASAQGAQWSQISQSLTGQGNLSLRDGVLLNTNILRIVIEKISRIPGIGETIQTNFPPQYKTALDEPSTLLKPLELPFSINQGVVNLDRLSVATDLFAMDGSGTLGLDRSINLRAALSMNPLLSQALIKSAPAAEILASSTGQIQIPLTVSGSIPQVLVLPDIQNLTSKIAVAKTQEVVASLINKPGEGVSGLENLLGKKTPASADAVPVPSPTASISPDAQAQSFESLLGKALNK